MKDVLIILINTIIFGFIIYYSYISLVFLFFSIFYSLNIKEIKEKHNYWRTTFFGKYFSSSVSERLSFNSKEGKLLGYKYEKSNADLLSDFTRVCSVYFFRLLIVLLVYLILSKFNPNFFLEGFIKMLF